MRRKNDKEQVSEDAWNSEDIKNRVDKKKKICIR